MGHDGYYAGAIPIELMKTEQHRISTDLKAATKRLRSISSEFDTTEDNLRQAVGLAASWHEAYLKATDRSADS